MSDNLFDKMGGLLSQGARSIKDRFTLEIVDLIMAVQDNSVEMVERCLAAGVDPNERDGLDRLALPMAVDNNQEQIVASLLKGGADPNQMGQDGQRVLYKAVFWENAGIIQALVQAGADPNLANKDGKTALEEAQVNGYDTLEILVSKSGQEKKARDRMLHEKQKAIAEEVRAKRERIQKEESVSAVRKSLRSLERKYGIKSGDYFTATMYAIREGEVEDVAVLLPNIKDINRIDEQSGATLLMAAILHQSTGATRLLLDAGANAFLEVPKYRHSAFSYVVSQEYHKLAAYMIKDRAVKNLLNNPDQALSPQFLVYKNPKMLDLLMQAGADIHFGGALGSSPLLKAIEKGSVAILPVLKRNKVDLNAFVDGKCLLSWAIYFNRMDWTIGLIKEGVNMDLQDKQGNTPLMLAVLDKKLELSGILVEEGADITLKNNLGKSVENLAAEMDDGQAFLALFD